jgi:outer membrane protein
MNRTATAVAAVLTVVLTAALSSAAWAQETTASLGLEECVRTALEHNPQMVSSAQNVAVARAGLSQSRSSYAPQLTLDASAGVNGSSGGAGPSSSQGAGAAGLILGMTFWRSGRQDSVSQSRASLRSATAMFADRRLSLAQLVSDDYYAVLAAAELVGVAKAGVDSAEQHCLQVQKQIEAGAVAPVEIHTVDDDLAQARLNLINARSTARVALATLTTDMGLPYTTDLQLAPSLMGAGTTTPTVAEAVETALRTRPDLQAQQASVEARRYGVRLAKTARGPNLDVGGQATQSYADSDGASSSWELTAGVKWPLADGGYTRAAQSAAEANLISSEADLQSLRNETTLEVQSALIELDRATEGIKASEEAVSAATARLDAAEVKYREGLGILVEVTDARQSLTSAEADNVRARYAYQVALISLQHAMGTLPLPAADAEVQP